MKFSLLSFLAFLSLNCLVLISPTVAQTAEKDELAGEFSVLVEDIRVEGLQRIEPGTVFSLIDIELEEVVDRKKVSEAIKALFNSGFFEDVKVFLEGNSLIVELKERPSIGSIDISGSKEFKEEALLEAAVECKAAAKNIHDDPDRRTSATCSPRAREGCVDLPRSDAVENIQSR